MLMSRTKKLWRLRSRWIFSPAIRQQVIAFRGCSVCIVLTCRVWHLFLGLVSKGMDVCIHIASFGMSGAGQLNKAKVAAVNVQGTSNVCVCRCACVRVCAVCSSKKKEAGLKGEMREEVHL